VAAEIKTLRFLHVFPSFETGGAQIRVASIVNSLPRSIRHSILALDGNFHTADRLDPAVPVDLVSPPPRQGRLGYARALFELIRSVKPSLALTYNWGSFYAIIAALVGRVAPVIHNECGLDTDEAEQLLPYRVWTRRFMLRETAQVIVTSAHMKRMALNDFLIPGEQVCYIPTGVDTERFRPRRGDEWRTAAGIPRDALVFGFAGGMRPVKNIELMIEAFALARLPRAWLALFGEGPSRQSLEQTAREAGVADRVIFAGYMPDTAPCYDAMDVFLLSSVTEQASNALLEAMSSGLPAIATAVGDNADMLAAAPPWALISPGDRDGLAQAMVRLAGDEGLRRQYGEKNRQRCLDHHSLAMMFERYEAVYRDVLGLRSWPAG
jgi:glycosyltransferase involved in cell wall biosynthesis